MSTLANALKATGWTERKLPTITEILLKQFETRCEREDRIWYECLERLRRPYAS